MKSTFALKDLGDFHFFLGIQVAKNAASLLLSQSKYVANLLAKVNMQDSTPCATPMASRNPLTQTNGVSFLDVSLYRSPVGAL